MVNFMMLGVGFIVNLILGTIILHIVASMLTKIEGATIMKALMAAVIVAILGLIFGLVSVYGSLIALIIAIVVIWWVYKTTWSKAIITWILYIVIVFIIGLILGFLGLAVFLAM